MVRLATILILLMCMLNLIPPLFKGGVYFDNVYYSILYLLLSFLGLSIPYLVPEIPKSLRLISTIIGSWFVAGLVNGLINMVIPTVVLNNSLDEAMYLKFMITFTISVTFIIIDSIWSKQKS